MKRRPRVVLDTNILISAILGSKVCKAILESFDNREFSLVLSPPLLKEITDVLADKMIGRIMPEDLATFLASFETEARMITPTRRITLCRDPKDNIILEAAMNNADIIVTGDKDLLILNSLENIPILTPAEFLKLLKSR